MFVFHFDYSVPQEIFDPTEFPASYKDNLPKEKLILQYCDNFCRQYVHLYRDRKPLFVNPINECGVEVSLSNASCSVLHSTHTLFLVPASAPRLV